MAEEEKKPKVYVETTVISDATALPARDIVLAARQIATREWRRVLELQAHHERQHNSACGEDCS